MNRRMFAHGWRYLPALALICLSQVKAAPPMPEQLFPNNTTSFVAISDINRLSQLWRQTDTYQFVNDPSMQPFLQDFQKNAKGFNFLFDTIGVSVDTVKAATGGELGWGIVLADATHIAHVLTLDFTGRNEGAAKLLAEMVQKLNQQGAQGAQRQVGELTCVVAQIPNGPEIVYGYKDNLLIIADHLPSVQGIMQRWAGAANNSLANVRGYQEVRTRSKPMTGEEPLVRWYFEPIMRMEAQMIRDPKLKKVKGDNLTQALRKEGVDGIKAVGGTVAVMSSGTQVLIRGAAYAPQPFTGALRMAKFLNEAPVTPDSWVPADSCGYATFTVDIMNAFDTFDTLFERLADEPAGTWKEIIDSMHLDKDGPKVNIRQDILANLKNQITVMNDSTKPISEKSERFVIGIPVKGAAAEKIVADAVRKCFQPDRRIRTYEFNGVKIFEYQSKEKQVKNGQAKKVLVGSTSFAVGRGHLFVSTHSGMIERVLSHKEADLGQTPEYQRVMNELTRLGMGPSNSRTFVRFDTGMEATYELLRANRLANAESLYSTIIHNLVKVDDEGKRLRADGSKLPRYDQVVKYMGMAGSYGVTDADGWRITGVILKK